MQIYVPGEAVQVETGESSEVGTGEVGGVLGQHHAVCNGLSRVIFTGLATTRHLQVGLAALFIS